MSTILATMGNQYSSLTLVSMNGYSYKIISGNKCLYQYEYKANAMKKWQELKELKEKNDGNTRN